MFVYAIKPVQRLIDIGVVQTKVHYHCYEHHDWTNAAFLAMVYHIANLDIANTEH